MKMFNSTSYYADSLNKNLTVSEVSLHVKTKYLLPLTTGIIHTRGSLSMSASKDRGVNCPRLSPNLSTVMREAAVKLHLTGVNTSLTGSSTRFIIGCDYGLTDFRPFTAES